MFYFWYIPLVVWLIFSAVSLRRNSIASIRYSSTGKRSCIIYRTSSHYIRLIRWSLCWSQMHMAMDWSRCARYLSILMWIWSQWIAFPNTRWWKSIQAKGCWWSVRLMCVTIGISIGNAHHLPYTILARLNDWFHIERRGRYIFSWTQAWTVSEYRCTNLMIFWHCYNERHG